MSNYRSISENAGSVQIGHLETVFFFVVFFFTVDVSLAHQLKPRRQTAALEGTG